MRYIFVFGAFTGLYFFNLSHLSNGVVILLHPLVGLVLARHEGHSPEAYFSPPTAS